MEAVVFIGLQGSGKSTFYKDRFFTSHMRISLDLLRTRHREKRFLETCIELQQRFVVDNTNPTAEERAVYIAASKEARFRITGYYFQSKMDDCKRRNTQRPEVQRIPDSGIHGTAARMSLPKFDEGFDDLFYVRIDDNGGFIVEEWKDEV